MSLSGKSVLGIALLVIGICAFLGIFGIHLGGLFVFFFGIVVACYGLKKLKDGRKGLGIIALIFALILLGHSLPFIFGLGFAIACIYIGWRMIKRGDSHSHHETAAAFSGHDDMRYEGRSDTRYKEVELDNGFDTEWKDFLKKQNKDKEEGTPPASD